MRKLPLPFENEEKYFLGGSENNDRQNSWRVIRIPFRNFARVTVSLPLGGFIFIIIWAIVTDLNLATQTHCGVRNFLPSMSAAMGAFPESERVWKACIALHAIPRFVVTSMYFRYFELVLRHRFLGLGVLACFLNIFENLGLIGLTFVTSKVNYDAHRTFFVIFLICSEVYMIIMCLTLYLVRNISPTVMESRSLEVKVKLLVFNIVSCLLSVCAYMRHNTYCEQGMYTIFALMEYAVVLSNMGFHMTAYWDFHDKILSIDICGCL